MTPELEPPPDFRTTPTGARLSIDRFNVHRRLTRRIFSGTRIELITCGLRVHYLYHLATATTDQWLWTRTGDRYCSIAASKCREGPLSRAVLLDVVLNHYIATDRSMFDNFTTAR
ncbi:hypothetical protein TNCV_2304931 [Trichonephila clavipes]|nr:hypothetical protein TNCV_2304931 [Trichonephila clavipes]